MTNQVGPNVPREVTMNDTGFVDAVIEVSGVQWATQKHVVESVLRARPGVASVAAEPGSWR